MGKPRLKKHWVRIRPGLYRHGGMTIERGAETGHWWWIARGRTHLGDLMTIDAGREQTLRDAKLAAEGASNG